MERASERGGGSVSDTLCERAPYDKESWYCLTHNRLEMREGERVRECECRLEADLLTLCEEHKQELERLKANPPACAIKARGGERA